VGTPEGRFAVTAVVPIAVALFLVELLPAFGETYGYFLDELYYLACAKRPALGYVDHPPLAPLALRGVVELLGDSLPALRLLPALAGGLVVILTGWMAHRLGGGSLAQTIAALSVAVAPIPLIVFGFFSMNCFELLLWSTACWILLELCRSGNERLWVPIGLVLGIALELKHTSILLIGGFGVATLLTPLRAHLARGWLWLGVLVTALLALPNAYWQLANGWPSLEFYRNLDLESNIPTSPLGVLENQIGAMNPATFPVWLAGAVFCFSARGRPYRALGWVFLTLLASAILGGRSRPDRIAGVYPLMFAAGGALLEATSRRRGGRWLRYAIPGFLVASLVLLAPLLLPFPPEVMANHPLAAGTNDSRREVGVSPIPLPWSHRLGSEEFVEAVAGVFRDLGPAERRAAVILAGDFAHAGAIEHFGPEHALPRVFSPHNGYFLWKPEPGLSPATVIAVGLDEELLRREFRDVETATVYRCAYCMGWRDDLSIHVARSPRRSLLELWPEIKRFGLPTRKLMLLDAAAARPDRIDPGRR
jgi:hypothetical protein